METGSPDETTGGDAPLGTSPAGDGLGTRTELEEIGPYRRRIKAAIPADAVRERLDESYREVGRNVRLPGFRPGRVPRRLLERRFGKEVTAEVKETLLGTSLQEILDELQLSPFGSPRFENVRFSDGEDFTYEIELDIRPEFDLPEYRGLEVERPEVRIEDEDVEQELEQLRERDKEPVESSAERPGRSHVLVGEAEILVDGEVRGEPQHAEFIPEQGVVRSEVEISGDLAEAVEAWDPSSGPLVVEAVGSDDHPEPELRGQPLQVRFRLDRILEYRLPELDDDFAQQFGCESVEDLRSKIREAIQNRAERKADEEVERRLIDDVVGATAIDLPDEFVERHLKPESETGHGHEHEHEHEHEHGEEAPPGPAEGPEGGPAGAESEEDREVSGGESGSGPGEGTASEKIEAGRRELREFLVIDRIAEAESIDVSDEEMKQQVQQMASVSGLPARDFFEYVRQSGKVEEIRLELRNRKVRSFLRENARFRPTETVEAASTESTDEESGKTEETGESPANEGNAEAPREG